jgi:hypothetical protein
MNRRDDRDLEKPHFYSQYWIDQAREAAGLVVNVSDEQTTATQVLDRFDSTIDDEPIAPHIPKAPPTLNTPLDEFDDLLPVSPTPKPVKQKPPAHPQRERLTNLADLAALGFGAGAETDELAISPDDDADDIISQLESEFDMGRVEPDDEEAASFETLSEEENEMWDDEEEEGDGDGAPHPPRGKPSSPRRPRRDY